MGSDRRRRTRRLVQRQWRRPDRLGPAGAPRRL